jgi:hypothetical protein
MTEEKAPVRFNATRHGVLSRYTALPWEDPEEYGAILEALREEHAPQGPTEEHLVEEVAGIVWRKRRRLAGGPTGRVIRLAKVGAGPSLRTCVKEGRGGSGKRCLLHRNRRLGTA